MLEVYGTLAAAAAAARERARLARPHTEERATWEGAARLLAAREQRADQ